MAGPIVPISSSAIPAVTPLAVPQRAGGAFQEALSSAIGAVEGSGREASASIERFLSGEGEDLHSTILAAQRAELTFDLFMQARNKVVSAYQEIMRMQM